MLTDLVELLYRYPGACRAAGRGLNSIAGLALICGAYAHVGTTAASIATGGHSGPAACHAGSAVVAGHLDLVGSGVPGRRPVLRRGVRRRCPAGCDRE